MKHGTKTIRVRVIVGGRAAVKWFDATSTPEERRAWREARRATMQAPVPPLERWFVEWMRSTASLDTLRALQTILAQEIQIRTRQAAGSSSSSEASS